MTLLEILGMSQKYSENFTKRLTVSSYLHWGLLTPLYIDHVRAIRNKAIEHRRYGMAFWMHVAIILRVIQKFLVELFKSVLGREAVYRLKRRIFLPESSTIDMDQNHDHSPAGSHPTR